MSGSVLDTDVVIAALDRSDPNHRRGARLIRRLGREGEPITISAVNYAEALVKPAESEETMSVAVDAIAALGIRPVAPGPAVAREAARIRGLGVSLADGFALAAALARADAICSFDRRVARAAKQLGVRVRT